LQNHLSAKERAELSSIDREAIAESVVQRFETCYDMVWKDVKQHLLSELGLPDVPNSPKPIFKLAAQNKLLPSATERWLEYADLRVSTAHDYSGEKAAAVVGAAERFVGDAIRLYEKLSGKGWE